MKIQKSNILGTNVVVYSAWVSTTIMSDYGTIMTIDGKWYGKLGTKRFNQNVSYDNFNDKILAHKIHYNDQYEEAYAAIIAEYPEARHGNYDNGTIEVYLK